MNTLLRTLTHTLGVGVLAVGGLFPTIAAAGDRGQIGVQPPPPGPSSPSRSLEKQSPPPPPGLDPTAPGAKIDAMDVPKLYLKPSNVAKVPPFRDSFLGAQATSGLPDDGGVGYPHYEHPPYRYDIWYRPHAFGYGTAERCAPSPFRPRGYGHLFAEPSTCFRMDYSRYVVKKYGTDYGPSYYRRRASETCDTCDHSDWYRPDCDPSRLRPRDGCERTRVWTIGGHHHHD